MNHAIVYALDFDGVICDSAVETAISGWKAARQIWSDMPEALPLEGIELFRQVRPIIETGYEAVLAMRLLHSGATVETLYRDHSAEFQRMMEEARIDSHQLKALFGATRDAWIASDRVGWIRENPLYPQMAEKLARLSETHVWYVITTKQERFVKMILNARHIDLPEERIFGLDRNMSKADVLKILLQQHDGQAVHFVEDRLLTLLKIQQEPALAGVGLTFAGWGYNTAEDKFRASAHGLTTCRLDDFLS